MLLTLVCICTYKAIADRACRCIAAQPTLRVATEVEVKGQVVGFKEPWADICASSVSTRA